LTFKSSAPTVRFPLGFGGGQVEHEYLVHRLLLRAGPPQDIASLAAQTAGRLVFPGHRQGRESRFDEVPRVPPFLVEIDDDPVLPCRRIERGPW
jgi:hypothetical protein